MVTASSNLGRKYDIKNKKINYLDIDGIDIVAIRVNYSQKMRYIDRIKSFLNFMLYSSSYLLKKNNYDLVFATSTPLTIAIPGLIAKYTNKIPFIFEVRDLWPEYPENFGILKNRVLVKLLEKFCQFVYNKAQHIVAISSSMAKRIERKYGISANKLSVIPIGSLNELNKYLDHKKTDEYMDQFNLREKFIVGYAGTIGYTNNMDSIINLADALKDYDDISFVIAGDGKEKERIEHTIKMRNLSNIKLIGKFNQKEIVNIIQMFDAAYISEMPINEEGKKVINAEDTLSNKFFDYIMVGKPVLINVEGEITKLMKEYDFGFYINDKDEKNIRDIILKLKKDKNLRLDMGKNALNVADIFDRNKMALEVEKLFLRFEEVNQQGILEMKKNTGTN